MRTAQIGPDLRLQREELDWEKPSPFRVLARPIPPAPLSNAAPATQSSAKYMMEVIRYARGDFWLYQTHLTFPIDG